MGQLRNSIIRRMRPRAAQDGFSLVEVIVSTGLLATGLLTLAAYMSYGLRYMAGTSFSVLAREKAREAVESVHTARDTGLLSWPKIRNVAVAGVFLDGPQALTIPGADGLVNTADDAVKGIETVTLPGDDGLLNTADDKIITLGGYTRQIAITDVAGENGQLRSIVVTIKYTNGPNVRTYTLTTYISSYS